MGPSQRGQVERLAGNLLKLARLEGDVSQRELAEAANVAESAIAEIESGARQLSLPELAHLLDSIDRELRQQLAPYDSHDDILDATELRLSADEQAHRRAVQDQFAAQLRQGATLETPVT
ncbi:MULTISPECIES: helix-turn-helix domain-containing protein [Mycolicibacterium]|uniref:Helix-turn-helix domain-containing protein n=1 Tax=Mycolicibacterium arenosum TaxID=2952157 RepID=A0ABT1MBN0_9MYCO|nr:helix-turn-helix transcriptional regulator [Mycolicibacterium sp. CAU 1645]MCP9276579.1 helix-turn-helix domain-containing protein [Mycolicibacterium sp. CAU 1645]